MRAFLWSLKLDLGRLDHLYARGVDRIQHHRGDRLQQTRIWEMEGYDWLKDESDVGTGVGCDTYYGVNDRQKNITVNRSTPCRNAVSKGTRIGNKTHFDYPA